jgi:hypothetical protein
MATGPKYLGTATYFDFVWSGGTAVISTESRTLEVSQQAQRIDVTVRGDSAKAFIADQPEITLSTGGLDTREGTPAWFGLPIGTEGTARWGRYGTVTGSPREQMPAIIQNKGYTSNYDAPAEWSLELASNGGTIAVDTWGA